MLQQNSIRVVCRNDDPPAELNQKDSIDDELLSRFISGLLLLKQVADEQPDNFDLSGAVSDIVADSASGLLEDACVGAGIQIQAAMQPNPGKLRALKKLAKEGKDLKGVVSDFLKDIGEC